MRTQLKILIRESKSKTPQIKTTKGFKTWLFYYYFPRPSCVEMLLGYVGMKRIEACTEQLAMSVMYDYLIIIFQDWYRTQTHCEHITSIKSHRKFTYILKLNLNSENRSMHRIIQSPDRVTSRANLINAVNICDSLKKRLALINCIRIKNNQNIFLKIKN